MKHTFFKALILTSFLVVAAGCGKDGGGGGSSSNNLGGPSNELNQGSKANFDLLGSWYSAAENTSLRPFRKYSQTISNASSGNNNTGSCPGEIKEYLGGFIKVCVYNGTEYNSGSTSGVSFVDYLVGPSGTNNYNLPNYCVAQSASMCKTGTQVTYGGKSANIPLQAALKNTQGLYMHSVTRLSTSLYQIVYTNSSLETQPVLTYKIDTSLHSIYNPVEIVDYRSNKVEYIVRF